MDRFENVTIFKPANIYFDGKVTSRTILFANGEKKTLGIMMPGEYTFGTGQKEIMEILTGELNVRLPSSEQCIKVTGGQTFEVPAHASFDLEVIVITDYCCSYLEA